jgi:hypothetical protein
MILALIFGVLVLVGLPVLAVADDEVDPDDDVEADEVESTIENIDSQRHTLESQGDIIDFRISNLEAMPGTDSQRESLEFRRDELELRRDELESRQGELESQRDEGGEFS